MYQSSHDLRWGEKNCKSDRFSKWKTETKTYEIEFFSQKTPIKNLVMKLCICIYVALLGRQPLSWSHDYNSVKINKIKKKLLCLYAQQQFVTPLRKLFSGSQTQKEYLQLYDGFTVQICPVGNFYSWQAYNHPRGKASWC